MRRARRAAAAGVGLAAAVVAVVGVAAAFGRPYRASGVPPWRSEADAVGTERAAEPLVRRLDRLAPQGVWVAIDTHGNRLRVMRGDQTIREAVCSTGSGVVLKDPRTDRTWVFDTPLGERRVIEKRRNPVWTKPDWAFIEEGFIPPDDWSLRRDDFSLGAYALYLGDGYLIHGTIFQTLLGRPVTHGCIRLGDQDLEYVYRTVPYGARVVLY